MLNIMNVDKKVLTHMARGRHCGSLGRELVKQTCTLACWKNIPLCAVEHRAIVHDFDVRIVYEHLLGDSFTTANRIMQLSVKAQTYSMYHNETYQQPHIETNPTFVTKSTSW